MTKQEETTAIRALKNAPYFSDFFGESDIEQMAQNVENDFSIELNCQFYQKANQLQEIINDLKKEYSDNMRNWGMKMIEAISNGTDEDEIYNIVKDEVGIDEIIKFKHSKKIELYDDEIDYLISKL